MSAVRKTVLAGLACACAATFWSAPVSAQYQRYDGGSYERGYDRGDGYERRRRYERRDDYDRGYERRGRYERDQNNDWGSRRARPADRAMPPGWGALSIDEQKKAIKNQREAQKKMIKGGGYLGQ